MTRPDLESCHGFIVEIIADGKPVLADLHSAKPAEAYITIPKPGEWTPLSPYFLTDDEVASMSFKSDRLLIGKIVLTSTGT